MTNTAIRANELVLGGRKGPATTADLVTAFRPKISKYEQALIFIPPPRQMNAVKGLAKSNDLHYCQAQGATGTGIMTDFDVYDSTPGYLTVGMNYNGGTPTANTGKGLAFPALKMPWDMDLGESLFFQFSGMTIGAVGNRTLFGNSNSTTEGFGVGLTLAGVLSLNFKGAGTAGQSMNLHDAYWDGTNWISKPVLTNTKFKLSVYIDARTRFVNAWINGNACSVNESPTGNGYGNAGTPLNAGSTQNVTAPKNFGFGAIPTDTSYVMTGVQPTAIEAFRLAKFPAGTYISDPAWLDWLFNRDSFAIFQDRDYTI